MRFEFACVQIVQRLNIIIKHATRHDIMLKVFSFEMNFIYVEWLKDFGQLANIFLALKIIQ